MKKKGKKKLTIDEYIDIGKGDITVYIIVTIILFAISLHFGIKYNFYLHLLFIGLIMIGRICERIDTFLTLKKIKKYLINNNLLDKIGNIDYWNDRYYFLTDNYIIIKQNKEIYSFKYSEIERIYKESYLELNKHSYFQEHLHILVNDNDFKILISTTVLVGEDYKDISDYLIKKNPNIIVDKTIKNKKINIFRIEKRWLTLIIIFSLSKLFSSFGIIYKHEKNYLSIDLYIKLEKISSRFPTEVITLLIFENYIPRID